MSYELVHEYKQILQSPTHVTYTQTWYTFAFKFTSYKLCKLQLPILHKPQTLNPTKDQCKPNKYILFSQKLGYIKVRCIPNLALLVGAI